MCLHGQSTWLGPATLTPSPAVLPPGSAALSPGFVLLGRCGRGPLLALAPCPVVLTPCPAPFAAGPASPAALCLRSCGPLSPVLRPWLPVLLSWHPALRPLPRVLQALRSCPPGPVVVAPCLSLHSVSCGPGTWSCSPNTQPCGLNKACFRAPSGPPSVLDFSSSPNTTYIMVWAQHRLAWRPLQTRNHQFHTGFISKIESLSNLLKTVIVNISKLL